jgi:hypothetical protein
VHDDDLLERRLEEAADAGDRAAGLVHVRLGLGQHRRSTGQPALDDVGAALVGLEAAPDPLGEQVEDHEADVVAVARVGRPGLPSPTTSQRLSAPTSAGVSTRRLGLADDVALARRVALGADLDLRRLGLLGGDRLGAGLAGAQLGLGLGQLGLELLLGHDAQEGHDDVLGVLRQLGAGGQRHVAADRLLPARLRRCRARGARAAPSRRR